VAWGIANEIPEWQEIPYASEISDAFGIADGLSFAFMNISKMSNESENSRQSDWVTINAAHELSVRVRNFQRDQVAILEPHIVVTMNLGGKLSTLGKRSLIRESEQANSYWLDTDGHLSLLIDTFHFSAPRKKGEADYYQPICNAIRQSRQSSS